MDSTSNAASGPGSDLEEKLLLTSTFSGYLLRRPCVRRLQIPRDLYVKVNYVATTSLSVCYTCEKKMQMSKYILIIPCSYGRKEFIFIYARTVRSMLLPMTRSRHVLPYHTVIDLEGFLRVLESWNLISDFPVPPKLGVVRALITYFPSPPGPFDIGYSVCILLASTSSTSRSSYSNSVIQDSAQIRRRIARRVVTSLVATLFCASSLLFLSVSVSLYRLLVYIASL